MEERVVRPPRWARIVAIESHSLTIGALLLETYP